MQAYIGTSGWHYTDWSGLFYPPEITGYNELAFYAKRFNTVENNSSFYRIASPTTYKTWDRMTPDGFKFSMKLNKLITHNYRLELNDIVRERVQYIVSSARVLGDKQGAILIQLPASFHCNSKRLGAFLEFFTTAVRAQKYAFDIAIEFRSQDWFIDEIYNLLQKYNVALVAGQSSRYPGIRRVTASFVYVRMHGPEKLFASKYASKQLAEWASYLAEVPAAVSHAYVYFNNDFHGYALDNAREFTEIFRAHER
jgi:uncharacterized protein YecE (DUF72 family)